MGHWFGRFIPITVGVLLIAVACTDPDKPSGIPDPKGNNGDVSNIGGDVAIAATLPTVTITAPAANAMAAYGELVQFSGTVSDNRDAPETLNVRWLSDLDLLNPGDVVQVHGDATYPGGVMFEFNRAVTRPLILLMGSERQGLSAEQSAICDQLVSLPMRGRVTSLNLSIATGVMLYAMLDKA